MVLITRRESINRQIVDIGKICKAIVLGIVCLLTPVIIIIVDPIHTIVNYEPAPRCIIYCRMASRVRNYLCTCSHITNADRFLEEVDQKLRVEEVGPFVFQEFHWYEDLELSEDGKTMAMTPKYSSEFLPEKSIAHPRDINLTLPNLPMLSAATLLAPYPSFIRYMYSTMASQLNAKAIINIDVHNYLWGYKDPLITLLHKLVPGVVYFDTIGLLDRFYDKESEYRMVVGATKQDRFQIKTVTKFRSLRDQGIDDIEVSEQNFTNMNTYEGVGYPPELTPDTPINWYRLGVCKTFELEYKGTRVMDYGGEGQVYDISNSGFASERAPTATKVYPNGLMDVSTCYYGLPYVASKAHFMDADPKLLDAIDGLKPDKELHKNEVIIDRRVGITFHTQATLQLNLVLEDITYNREARRLANTVVPIVRLRVDQLKMSSGKMIIFYLVYLIGPYTLMFIEALLVILGLLLLAYAVKSMYFNWIFGNQKILQSIKEKKRLSEKHSGVPLIIGDE